MNAKILLIPVKIIAVSFNISITSSNEIEMFIKLKSIEMNGNIHIALLTKPISSVRFLREGWIFTLLQRLLIMFDFLPSLLICESL